jgi:hypothetical protein
VGGFSTAGVITVETTESEITTSPGMTSVHNYFPLTLISTWRYLGECFLGSFHSLNLNQAAQQRLTIFAQRAQVAIYGMSRTDPVVDGSIVMQVNSIPHENLGTDFRLLRYANGMWINIGQDIIYDYGNIHGTNAASSILISSGAILTIANAWWGQATPLPDKIAFTNPVDKRRILYTRNSSNPNLGSWADIGEYSFDAFRGRQYYRNVVQENVRSLRIYIPGLVDTSDIRGGENVEGEERIQAIVGEIQLFEQFKGTDISFKDVRVNGASASYGETIVTTSGSSINIVCEGLTIDGVLVSNNHSMQNRLFAQGRNSSGLTWSAISQSGSLFSLEPGNAATSITLFYRMGGTSNNASDRMFPFFTFVISRQ